jgi:hypothetical protein
MASFGVAGWGTTCSRHQHPLRAFEPAKADTRTGRPVAIARVDVSRLTQPETTSEPPALQPKSGARSTDGITSLEGASRHSAQQRCHADGAAHALSRPTAVDREEPLDADATGTRRARPVRTKLAQAWRDGHQLDRRVTIILGDHLPRWQGPQTHGSGWVRGSNPVPGCFAVRGRSGGWPVTCDCDLPTVTARARREPAVADAMRTQHGPGSRAWKARPGCPLSPDIRLRKQVSTASDRPLLTVRDRWVPMLRARRGHGRRGRTRFGRCSAGRHLNWRVRPVLGDHCLVGKPSAGGCGSRLVGLCQVGG